MRMKTILVIVAVLLLAGQVAAQTATPVPWATLTPLPTPNPAATQAISVGFLAGADVQFAETIVQRYHQFNTSATPGQPGPLDTFMYLLLIMMILIGLWSIQKRIARLR